MDFEKLAPWNWFKKEEESRGEIIPVKRDSELSVSRHEVQNEFERLFDSLRQGFHLGWPSTSLVKKEWLKPSLDIASDEKEYSVKVELPGIDADNITIEYSGGTLRIKGEKAQEKEEKGKDFYKMERSYGSFQRILDLPEDVDEDKITSRYKDGILSISIPKKMLPKAQRKQIEIKTES
jgi:HSP20 family protein